MNVNVWPYRRIQLSSTHLFGTGRRDNLWQAAITRYVNETKNPWHLNCDRLIPSINGGYNYSRPQVWNPVYPACIIGSPRYHRAVGHLPMHIRQLGTQRMWSISSVVNDIDSSCSKFDGSFSKDTTFVKDKKYKDYIYGKCQYRSTWKKKNNI